MNGGEWVTREYWMLWHETNFNNYKNIKMENYESYGRENLVAGVNAMYSIGLVRHINIYTYAYTQEIIWKTKQKVKIWRMTRLSYLDTWTIYHETRILWQIWKTFVHSFSLIFYLGVIFTPSTVDDIIEMINGLYLNVFIIFVSRLPDLDNPVLVNIVLVDVTVSPGFPHSRRQLA